MQLLENSKATTDFLTKLAAADVIVIDDEKFIITDKAGWAGEPIKRKIEDHEKIVETDYTHFTWWEVAHELTQINEQQWKIGESEISFLALSPF